MRICVSLLAVLLAVGAVAMGQENAKPPLQVVPNDVLRASDLEMLKTTFRTDVPANHALVLTEVHYQDREHRKFHCTLELCGRATQVEKHFIVVDLGFFQDIGTHGALKYRTPAGVSSGMEDGYVSMTSFNSGSELGEKPVLVAEVEMKASPFATKDTNQQWRRVAVYGQLVKWADAKKIAKDAPTPSGETNFSYALTLENPPPEILESEKPRVERQQR